MAISDLMTRNVWSCVPDENLRIVATRMQEKDCGCLPVREPETKRVVGMITDRDICLYAAERDAPLSKLTVRDAMTADPKSCKPEDDVEYADRLMQTAQVRRLPVIDGRSELVGVVSLADLARTAAEHEAHDPAITGRTVTETLSAICQPTRSA